MAKLAEVGFTQSYTYFTWRTEQHGPEGLRAYLEELAGPKADYMRPNFWPNTPDILAGPAPQRAARRRSPLRLVLAATMTPELGHLQRLRAVRERAGVRHQRGVPRTRRSTRSSTATGTRPTRLAP